MQLLGYDITRTKQIGTAFPVDQRNSIFGMVRESFTGAWQRNILLSRDNVLTYAPVFSCVTLIMTDIAKCGINLQRFNETEDIWETTTSSAYSPFIKKPNRYQNRIQFVENWITSKLIWGNMYMLKERDARNVVVKGYILDPQRVLPLVAPDGAVFYQVGADYLSGVEEGIVVPASEIIHDRMNCLYHPLVGISPISACALAATQGAAIQNNSSTFFANASRPSGILTAPYEIGDETAARLKAHWETEYTGGKTGKVAVLGDGLEYKPMSVNPVDAQLIDQLKWTVEDICAAFHVPPFMIIGGSLPVASIEASLQLYYQQCLQTLIENLELSMGEGLALPDDMQVEVDTDDLLRMDTQTKVTTAIEGIKGALFKPNEARKKFNLSKVKGGDALYLQQQNFSLEALAKRDAQPDPFGKVSATGAPPSDVLGGTGTTPPSPTSPTTPPASEQPTAQNQSKFLDDALSVVKKELADA